MICIQSSKNTEKPKLSSVSIASDNPTPSLATATRTTSSGDVVADVVTLTIVADQEIQTPQISFTTPVPITIIYPNNTTSNDMKNWTATFTLTTANFQNF